MVPRHDDDADARLRQDVLDRGQHRGLRAAVVEEVTGDDKDVGAGLLRGEEGIAQDLHRKTPAVIQPRPPLATGEDPVADMRVRADSDTSPSLYLLLHAAASFQHLPRRIPHAVP